MLNDSTAPNIYEHILASWPAGYKGRAQLNAYVLDSKLSHLLSSFQEQASICFQFEILEALPQRNSKLPTTGLTAPDKEWVVCVFEVKKNVPGLSPPKVAMVPPDRVQEYTANHLYSGQYTTMLHVDIA